MDTKVEYIAERGQLTLECDEPVFARIREAVINAADLKELVPDLAPEGVQMLLIAVTADARHSRLPSRFSDRAALLGCGLVAFAVLFVLTIGIGTIAGWVH